MIVDLPQPFGPSSAVTLQRPKSTLTSLSARVQKKVSETCDIVTAGAASSADIG